MLWALIFMLLKLMQFHICHLHHQSVVVGLGSIKFPLSFFLCLLSLNPITSCQVSYSYHLDKEPEGESCQMSVFDRWDLCVRLVYISSLIRAPFLCLSIIFRLPWGLTSCVCLNTHTCFHARVQPVTVRLKLQTS